MSVDADCEYIAEEYIASVEAELENSAELCATRDGRLDVLRWLHKHGTVRLEIALWTAAVAHGHADIVAWLRVMGCPGSR